ncbi:MAG TPA: Uma2 family endonuclease [Polyangiaceae bacterium]|nr:Uma2 family endonuclease [Polyangiaceae bacterium]
MGDAAQRRASYEDVLAAPSHVIAELVAGVLHTQARPRTRHARSASRLGGVLDGPFDRGTGGPGGWLLLDEPELHLGPEPDILVPDLAGWRRERMPELPDVAFLTLAPDWACEILSPSTEDFDRAEKVPVYAREGVTNVWLLDPQLRTLEVLRLDGSTYRIVTTVRGEARVHAEPFDAIELELALLWAT